MGPRMGAVRAVFGQVEVPCGRSGTVFEIGCSACGETCLMVCVVRARHRLAARTGILGGSGSCGPLSQTHAPSFTRRDRATPISPAVPTPTVRRDRAVTRGNGKEDTGGIWGGG